MKQTIIVSILSVILVGFLVYYFKPEKKFDTKPYKVKIDSLQNRVIFFTLKNDSLQNRIFLLENFNDELQGESSDLRRAIYNLKHDSSRIKIIRVYTPMEADSFFLNRYGQLYNIYTKDTTRLPLPVTKATIVDLAEYDKTKSILFKTDSLVAVQTDIITNKQEIINVLNKKEIDNQAIIDLHLKQIESYKSEVDGLQISLKKSNRSIRNQKIKTVILGIAAGAVLIATHK
jgi:hypothetical protein